MQMVRQKFWLLLANDKPRSRANLERTGSGGEGQSGGIKSKQRRLGGDVFQSERVYMILMNFRGNDAKMKMKMRAEQEREIEREHRKESDRKRQDRWWGRKVEGQQRRDLLDK